MSEALCDVICSGGGPVVRDLVALLPPGDVNKRDGHGAAPLHCASGYNNVPAAAALLLVPGVEVNLRTTTGNTPVVLAARNSSFHF